MEKRNRIYKKLGIWTGILFVQFLLFYFVSISPTLLSYHQQFFEFKKDFHLSLFENTRFSVGDFFYIGLVGYLILLIGWKGLKQKYWKNVALQLLVLTNILYFIYQAFWGLLYFQKSITQDLKKKKFSKQQLEKISLVYLEKCKASRELVQEDKSGVFMIKDYNILQKDILIAQDNIPQVYSIWNTNPRLNLKHSIFSAILSYTGISGYYNPFSSEAQCNALQPQVSIPFTIAHERAHQLGIAREQDANFYAYLLGLKTKNIELQHSINWIVLKSLMRMQIKENAKFVENLKKSFNKGMNRDLEAEKEFYNKHKGLITKTFSLTNDWFLKLNKQEGINTYAYFIYHVIEHEIGHSSTTP